MGIYIFLTLLGFILEQYSSSLGHFLVVIVFIQNFQY